MGLLIWSIMASVLTLSCLILSSQRSLENDYLLNEIKYDGQSDRVEEEYWMINFGE